MDTERRVPSPCVSICCLDDADICLGCQRTVEEITGWNRMDNTERRVVLGLCHERARAGGMLWEVGAKPNA
jgi:predicted Fe-S protein YdhL (DUF1289 family)